MVRDCDGKSISHIYKLTPSSTFSDNKLKAKQIKVEIKPMQKNTSAANSTAKDISSIKASDIISNLQNKEYGFRYNVSIPQLSYTRTFFTQVAIIAPNRYLHCATYCDYSYKPKYAGIHWDFIGADAFKEIYKYNSSIPTGTWTVELYWDGMRVNKSTFIVN